MGFALSLFVNAANRNIVPADPADSAFSEDVKSRCDEIYVALCGEPGVRDTHYRQPIGGEASLYQTFRVLCEHYDGHPTQVPLCARVLALHFLMLRSAGSVLAGWAQAHPSEPRYVLLPPAVIHAIASVHLERRLLLEKSSFLQEVQLMAASHLG